VTNKIEIYESAARIAGDLAGVFEFDGDTSYFYLYKTSGSPGQKVLGTIHIVSGIPDFKAKDIAILWNRNETAVGLFIRLKLWAVFDSKTGMKHGGNYDAQGQPNIASEISSTFNKPAKL
jgi:hypothetical protein